MRIIFFSSIRFVLAFMFLMKMIKPIMHYAEALLEPVPKKEYQCAVMTNGQRQWISYYDATVNTMDFNEIGNAYETEQPIHIRTIGLASVRVIDANALHQFTYSYMKQRR